ncbi:MAG: hypothetical protein ACTH5B_05410 [Marinomonas sp.]|uniref:hypothetical protein n=1 Tax=Marinomonas sp. TaxID=1904862 RepID=UPI003F9E90C2
MAKLDLKDGQAVSLIKAILAAYSKPDQKIIFEKVGNDLIEGFNPNGSTKRRLSKLKHDPEMLAYIITLPLETMTQRDVLEVSIKKFGEERAPSKTSFNRSWSWLIHQRNQLLIQQRNQSIRDDNLTLAQFNRVKGEFIASGTTITKWCRENSVTVANVRSAMLGSWNGPKASELKKKILDAAGLTMEDLVND